MSEQEPNKLKASESTVSMTLTIIRAKTGKKETVQLVCTPINEEKDLTNVNNSPNSLS